MQTYWSNFAKTGNPGSASINGKTIEWSEYSCKNRETIWFHVNKTQIKNNYDNHHCQFWDSLGYNWLYS